MVLADKESCNAFCINAFENPLPIVVFTDKVSCNASLINEVIFLDFFRFEYPGFCRRHC